MISMTEYLAKFFPAILAVVFFGCAKTPTGVQRGAEGVTTYVVVPGPKQGLTGYWEDIPFEPEQERLANVRLSRDKNKLMVYHKWPPQDYLTLGLQVRGVTDDHIRGRFQDEMWNASEPVMLIRKTNDGPDGFCPEMIEGLDIKWPKGPDKLYSLAGKISLFGKQIPLRGRYAYACDCAVSPSRKFLAVRSLSHMREPSGIFSRSPTYQYFQIFDVTTLEEKYAVTFGDEYKGSPTIEGWLQGSTYVLIYEGAYVNEKLPIEVQVIRLD